MRSIVFARVHHAKCTNRPQMKIATRKWLIFKFVVVEAAGVEPASESTPSQASTCVAALEVSHAPSKSDGNRHALAPNCLAGALRGPARRPACFYDIQPRPTGGSTVDVA